MCSMISADFCGGRWVFCCLYLFWLRCCLPLACGCLIFYIYSVKFCLTGCQLGGWLVDLRFLHGGCVATAGRVYSSRAPIVTLNRFESPCQVYDVVLSCAIFFHDIACLWLTPIDLPLGIFNCFIYARNCVGPNLGILKYHIYLRKREKVCERWYTSRSVCVRVYICK